MGVLEAHCGEAVEPKVRVALGCMRPLRLHWGVLSLPPWVCGGWGLWAGRPLCAGGA